MIEHIKKVLRLQVRKVSTWAGAALIAALPWTNQIIAGVTDYMPRLQPYIPDNIYKTMGWVTTAGAMVISIYGSHKKAKAAQ